MSGAYYNDHDKHCAEWLRNLSAAGLICPGRVDDRDIRDVLPSDLDGYAQIHLFAGIGLWSHALRMAGWRDDRAVWTISCPCQPFSQAGAGEGIFDDRHLWPAAHWLIAQHRPVTIFGEQVDGPAGRAWLDIVSADLETLDYACGAVRLCSAGFGAPNIRPRIFWVADASRERRDGRIGCGAEARGWSGPSRGSWLGNAEGGGCGVNRLLSEEAGKRQGAGESALADEAVARGLGDASDARLPHTESQELFGPQRHDEGRATEQSGCASNPWSEPQWVESRDGRFRPFESGSFPLAPRHPGDVAKLRAYGNSINPYVAAEVIRAWMEQAS